MVLGSEGGRGECEKEGDGVLREEGDIATAGGSLREGRLRVERKGRKTKESRAVAFSLNSLERERALGKGRLREIEKVERDKIEREGRERRSERGSREKVEGQGRERRLREKVATEKTNLRRRQKNPPISKKQSIKNQHSTGVEGLAQRVRLFMGPPGPERCAEEHKA